MPNDAAVAAPATDTTPATPPAAAPAESLISSAANPPAETPAESTPPETTPPESAPPAPEPVTLESLKLPEGVEVNQEALNQFLEVVNTDGLSRAEMAQKFIDLQMGLSEKASAAAVEAAQSLWDQTQGEWMAQCRALPDIGGERLQTTLSEIHRGLVAVGADKELFEALNLTGAGSHPAVVKAMHKLVQPFLEQPPTSGGPPKGSLPPSARLYPTMQPKE